MFLLIRTVLAITLGLMVPVGILFVECTAALFPRRQRQLPNQPKQPKVTILVPAHNEALVIGSTLKQLLPQLAPQDQLVVIADNCEDQTADIARTLGAEVIERDDLERRGKGYALDYGLKFLAPNPPEVVVVIDADSVIEPGTITQIANLAVALAKPVQATYLLSPPANPEPKAAVSTLAFLVKNLVRPQGLNRLGLPCLLTGTGMAFPWSAITTVPLASGNIVEDMQLGIDLAIAGYAAEFCLDAQVTGTLPQQQAAAKSQRTRWEHGHLQTLLTQVPRLLKAAIHQKSLPLLALALDLSVPPLSLLVLLWLVALGGAILAGWIEGAWTPTWLLAIEGVLITISIVAAWVKFGRASISGSTLLAAPIYILWKLPLYFTFLVQRQTKWIRTARDPVNAPKPQGN